MPWHRDPLPDDLEELNGLCRAGKLFAVQEWIASGKRFQRLPARCSDSPLMVALQTGFHSMVEVFLKAGVDQDEKDCALRRALSRRRLDFAELLVAYGANPRTVSFEDVIETHNPPLIRWFIDRGIDMEEGLPIAHALLKRHRGFLGIYMDLRDRIPSDRRQAAMALRVHCREGSMRWVALLLWAGTEPREKVPDLEYKPPEEFIGTALEDAVHRSQIEVVRKIGIDPKKDNVTELLWGCFMCKEPEIVRMLLEAGANPNEGVGDLNPMQSLICNFQTSLDHRFSRRDPEAAVRCLEIAASFGGRWRPADSHAFRYFRQAVGQASHYSVVSHIHRIVKAGVIEREVFAR